jgi:hypothetical protein
MALATVATSLEQIGLTAGEIWRLLENRGPLTFTELVRETGAPRDLVMQAIGWLAREDQLVFEDSGRRRLVLLKRHVGTPMP